MPKYHFVYGPVHCSCMLYTRPAQHTPVCTTFPGGPWELSQL